MSVKKNYMYNIIYQIVLIILPIITVPYVSRVLGPGGLGTNSYTNSIVQYFILVGTLGMGLYGNKTIASSRENKIKTTNNFWSLIVLQFICTIIALILYLIYAEVFGKSDKLIFLIQGINIFASAFDISWFLMGLEEFKKTVTRNVIIRVAALALIFVFVRGMDDLWKYVLINALALLIGQLSIWVYVPRFVRKPKLEASDVIRHVSPAFKHLLPLLAIQVYSYSNKIIIKALTDANEVGFYDNAEKIVKLSLALISSLGPVMLPRIANIYANKEYDKMQEYMNKTFKFVNYLAIPMMFGLAAISTGFAPFFFSEKFAKSGSVMMILSLMVPAVAWSTITGMQVLLPVGKVKEYTISVTSGAIVNILFNFIFIPIYKANGAAISIVLTEFTISLIQLYASRKSINIKQMFSGIWKYVIAGVVMFAIVKLINILLTFNAISLMLQVFVGALSYFAILILLKSEENLLIYSIVKQIASKAIIRIK